MYLYIQFLSVNVNDGIIIFWRCRRQWPSNEVATQLLFWHQTSKMKNKFTHLDWLRLTTASLWREYKDFHLTWLSCIKLGPTRPKSRWPQKFCVEEKALAWGRGSQMAYRVLNFQCDPEIVHSKLTQRVAIAASPVLLALFCGGRGPTVLRGVQIWFLHHKKLIRNLSRPGIELRTWITCVLIVLDNRGSWRPFWSAWTPKYRLPPLSELSVWLNTKLTETHRDTHTDTLNCSLKYIFYKKHILQKLPLLFITDVRMDFGGHVANRECIAVYFCQFCV